MIVGVQGTYGERIEQTLKGVRQIRPYIDRMVVIVDETVSEKQKERLKEARAEVYFHPWEDSMVKMRNQLLQKAQTEDWLIAFDPDEVYDIEFCKDLRGIIDLAEKNGIGMLLVAAHDETLMNDGNVSKSVSGFKKPWIFKKNLGVHYEGVGETQNVHETPVLAPNTKIEALPDKYFYTHYKFEWEIWERAARNVFMCGGGGNVGARNVEWVRLRKICEELGIKNWTQARAYFRRGKIDPRLRQWLIDNRYEGTDYEHEMQDFFRWYKYLHPEELEGYEPEMEFKKGAPMEVARYVEEVYKEVTGAEITEDDKNRLADLILTGQVRREQLPTLIQRYRKEILVPPSARGEKVRLPVPVDVDVHVTDELFLKALIKSKTYWAKIKPRMDLGKFIEEQVWDKERFHQWFYENQNEITIEDLQEYVTTHGMNTIALCIMGYSKVLPMILESVEVCTPHVDEIHIQGDDFTEKDIMTLEDWALHPPHGCYVHIEPWKEDFSDYKNRLLRHANTHWVLVCDHDEIPTPELAEHLREIITKSERGEQYNLVGLQVIGQTVNREGEVIHIGEKVPGKQNLHVNVKTPYQGTPHVGLKMDYYPWKTTVVPYAYKHIKEEGIDLQRSARNVFLGGGGDNVKEKNPLWVGLRGLAKKLGVDSWKGFHEYLQGGNVDRAVLDWFKKAKVFPWKDDELTHIEKYYFSLHPEEKPDPDSIAICIMTERKNLSLVMMTVSIVGDIFDEVIVQGNDFNTDDIHQLQELGARTYVEPWNDEFSEYKNKLISHARSEWVLVLDYDEIPGSEMLEELRKIVEQSENGTKYNLVGFKSVDVLVDEEGIEIKRDDPKEGKELLHLNVKAPYYGSPHIWLKPNYFPWKPIKTDLVYLHAKTEMKILKQSTLNFFLGGAGDNLREKNPLWVELRALTDELGLKTWDEFGKYLKEGNVDPRLLEIFEKAYNTPWHVDELKHPKIYYYKLHPEEVGK